MDTENRTFLEELPPESADLDAKARGLNTNYDADIVLVAGLGGNPVDTWRAKDEQKTLWPTSLLPFNIGDIRVRVWTLKYNCTLRGSASAARIRDHANVLLVHLNDQREDDDEAKSRPIVFVGHSLGGIIIKQHHQTIMFAYKNPRYKYLWEATRGIMFFSTPHYGMSPDLWADFVRYVLQLDEPFKGALPTDGMLATIRDNKDELSNISEDFESRLQDMSFITFIETMPIPQMNCVADFLPDRLSYEEKKAYYSLAKDETHSFFLGRKSTPGTCGWTDAQPDIQAFLDGVRGHQDLWICGPPACGKTFLAKHIINKLNPLDRKLSGQGQGRPPTVIHYFVSDSLPDRGHLQGLLRATAHQALRLKPSLMRRILSSSFQNWNSERPMTRESLERDLWTGDMLKLVWPAIMAEVTKNHAIVVVIDGFDELDEDSRNSFLGCLQHLRGQAENPENLRLLFLSRELDGLDVAPAHRVAFQRYNIGLVESGRDISRTVDEAVDRLWKSRRFAPSEFREKVGNQIHLRSDGTYLWAALLSQDLDRNRTITSPSDVKTIIQELPPEAHTIQGLYDYILDRLATIPHVAGIVRQALLWASVQREGLKPAEFNIAQAIGRAMEDHKGTQITQEMLSQYLDEKVAITLDFHCGHIVKFQDGRLELVHGSLKDYIMKNGIRIRGPGPHQLTPGVTMAERLHAELARTCVTYLTLPPFRDSGLRPQALTPHAWEAKVRTRLKQQKLSRYASLYWDQHIRDAGMSWRSEKAAQAAQRQLNDDRTEYAKCWTEIWWLFRLWPTTQFPSTSASPVADILPLDYEESMATATESTALTVLEGSDGGRRDSAAATTEFAGLKAMEGFDGERLDSMATTTESSVPKALEVSHDDGMDSAVTATEFAGLKTLEGSDRQRMDSVAATTEFTALKALEGSDGERMGSAATATESSVPKALEGLDGDRIDSAAAVTESTVPKELEESDGDGMDRMATAAESSAPQALEGHDGERISIATSEDGSFISAEGRESDEQALPPPGQPQTASGRTRRSRVRRLLGSAGLTAGVQPGQNTEPSHLGLRSPPGEGGPSPEDQKKETPPAPLSKRRLGWMKRVKMAGAIIGTPKVSTPSIC
ncbi:hypothetical protein CHGG_07556 [Chaetomium globosum CBS 148.51]|uniref:Nephrocystin 3-like N-terminal domain-containing protein n=1 Tax=Chaetomium globosum (strain ATCC 6205 / CBS 148.51 / DSM 1962 / NBRC 6347 / NRRL 1970) TaxID=306901 RepID=Q2GWU8_CHAGB|nr:uncharacterized protein CHGG_07556 [Chaetomium globosum CBS 148.51]EAQ86303.1 hypothetical protein CHGG_07556 [Chaetomium globosum CBS 148.51]